VRDHDGGRAVTALVYEAYEGLAVDEGERILGEALERFPAEAAVCVHRLGRIDVGETAVWIGVSAAHRKAAFAACEYIIDELKSRVPIWKKELYADGDAAWVGAGRGVHVPRAGRACSLRMIDPDTALSLVRDTTEPLAPVRVPVRDALGLTLAEAVWADRAYPPFDRAMMDGYAVRLADAGGAARVAGEIAAGGCVDQTLEDGVTYAIMTGAPCPPGSEAVAPVEVAERRNGAVHVPSRIAPGEHIARMGSECAAGTVVARPGDRITPLVIANLATFGYTHVRAVPKPVCAVITTGSELADENGGPGPFQIRDANGPMLAALLDQAGIRRQMRGHAADNLESLRAALEEARHADVVLLTGGVSAGAYDVVPAALAAHGVDVLFHKVTQKPGKPLLFGKMGTRLFFGLPGNPLATHLGFHRYVLPALWALAGCAAPPQPPREGCLTGELRGVRSRTLFQLCGAVWIDGAWHITPLPCKGSADIFSVATANAYVRVDPGAAPRHAGEYVPFTMLGEEGPYSTGGTPVSPPQYLGKKAHTPRAERPCHVAG